MKKQPKGFRNAKNLGTYSKSLQAKEERMKKEIPYLPLSKFMEVPL